MTLDRGICPHCSKPIERSAAFCPNCGGRLSLSVPATPTAAPLPIAGQAPRGSSAERTLVLLILVVVGIGFLYWIGAGRSLGGGGGGPAAVTTPDPTERPTAPPAWSLIADDVTYTSETGVGGQILLNATITNSGTAASPLVRFQLADIDDYADVVSCDPDCDATTGFGDIFLDLPGVAPGAATAVAVELVATKIGAAKWSVLMYDSHGGDPFFVGEDVTTVIR